MRPLGALSDLFLPRHCAVCGTTLLSGEKCLCTKCIIQMPLTCFWEQECSAMSDRLNSRIQQIRDSRGMTGYEPYSRAAALYFYKEGYRGLSQRLKYKADITLGKYLASALAGKLLSGGLYSDVDLIVPVPLHWTRRLSRGYNQAEVIAGVLSGAMDCRKEGTAVLRRVRRTRSQAHLGVGSKAANVQGAFRARFSSVLPHHILLVDDVCTTASTLAECHVALRDALVDFYGHEQAEKVRISAATLAFVGD